MSNKNADETTRQVLHEIERAIGDIQFGSVESRCIKVASLKSNGAKRFA